MMSIRSNKSSASSNAENAPAARRRFTLAGAALALTLLFAGTQADAQPVRFGYTGGRWSHARHAGWNRYWGGPSVGFYYAPTPVYVVPGYAAPSYYSGSSFWTSNPAFGLSLNFGGGNYYGGPRYYGGSGRYYHASPRYYGGSGHSYGGHSYGGHSYGSHSYGGHSYGGNRGRR